MVEKNVYFRLKGEHSQRQRHVGESRMDMTMSHVGREGRGEPAAAARRSKMKRSNQKCLDYIKKGSWGKGSLSPGLENFRVW